MGDLGLGLERQIRGHVSEASEGLEKMRYKNRGGLKRKHYPYAHETNTIISHQNQFKQGHTIDLATVTKYSEYYYIHGGILLLIWSTRNFDPSKTP